MVSVPRPTPATPRRAAIYVRVSTRAQAESKDKGRVRPIRDAEHEKEQETSIDTQLAACRTYALAHGYAVDEAHIYREVHTGVELWERAELARARDAVRRQAVGVVVAYAIDRLARDPVHLGVVISEAEHAGVAVEFVTEPLDASPEGQLIRFVRGYAAKVEHEKIKERTVRGHRARVMAGKPWGARVPYGYQWADAAKSTFVVDPVAGVIVRRIFAHVLEGRSVRAIAAELSADGVLTPN